MKINWKKQVLPHLLAVVVFIVLSVVYCSPVLQGEVVNQSDMTQVEGMAHEAKTYYAKTHEKPLWTNSMFGGMPSYLIFTGPSVNKFSQINQLTMLWLPQPINMLFIAMLGVYFLLFVLGFKYGIRLFGGVAYGFSSYNLILITAGHITKMMTMAWMAPLLAGVILVYRGRYLLGAIVTIFSSALLIYNNHFQVIYYMLIMLVFFIISQFIIALREKKLKPFVIASLVCLGAGVLSALPAMDNLMITREYASYSIRGSRSELTLQNQNGSQVDHNGLDIDYAYQWSLGKLETFSILIPNVFGGPPSQKFVDESRTFQALTQLGVGAQQAAGVTAQAMYWGPQPFTTPVYFGALICFLFILFCFLVKSKHKWWILAITLVSILMSWGKQFPWLNDFLFYHLPLYNKFRAPSMMMLVPQLTFVIMACWALQEVVAGRHNQRQLWDALKKSLYVAAGLIVLVWLAVSSLGYSGQNDALMQQQAGEALLNAIREDRASLMHQDAFRSLIFILLLFAALWALITQKIKPVAFSVIAGLLLLVDLFPVDKRYMNENNFTPAEQYANIIQPSTADQDILRDKDPDYRVLNLSVGINNPGNIFNGDAITSYFHKSVGGYSPAKLWRYQDLIDFQLGPEISRILDSLRANTNADSSILSIFRSSPVLNLLNTRYFIVNPNAPPVTNSAALGNAWFVSEIHWAANADSEMIAMRNFRPANTVIIDQSLKNQLGDLQTPYRDSSSRITLTQYGLNEMKYVSENSGQGLAVFSEIYYPAGWEAYIDGKASPILRVNYAFRGLVIPAGKHQIDFKFHPRTFFTGEKISGISSILLILFIVVGLAWELYRKTQSPASVTKEATSGEKKKKSSR
jgi:hypothetical protein